MNSFHNDVLHPILTDYYQITMAYSYYKMGKHNEDSVFESFFRKAPFNGEYLIFCGVGEVVKFVQSYKFKQEHLDYLKSVLPPDADESFFEYLKNADCSKIKIRAIKEGSIVFPMEPLLQIEGPLIIVQMLETTLINLTSFPSLIATNASRMRNIIGNDKKLLEFGLRRAQGIDGGMAASVYSYLGGFDATSNVMAGYKVNIPIEGTMAHSFVTSFSSLDDIKDDLLINDINLKERSIQYQNQLQLSRSTSQKELAAFISFAYTYPNKFLCLVDSFNTLNSGVPNFLCVAAALIDANQTPIGIRLDSGDLTDLSIKSKILFNTMGKQLKKDFSKLIVVASDDINEEKLIKFKENNHQIGNIISNQKFIRTNFYLDSFGIGTNLVTCQKQPSLGMVYKLTQLNGEMKMKFSDSRSKQTLPGRKNVYRIWVESSDVSKFDIITHNQTIEPFQEIQIRNMIDTNQKYIVKPKKVVQLLETVFENNEIQLSQTILVQQYLEQLKEAKQWVKFSIAQFDQQIFEISKPLKYQIMITEEYYREIQEIQESIIFPIIIN